MAIKLWLFTSGAFVRGDTAPEEWGSLALSDKLSSVARLLLLTRLQTVNYLVDRRLSISMIYVSLTSQVPP